LVFLIFVGSRLTKLLTDPTVSADLSNSGYSAAQEFSWLEDSSAHFAVLPSGEYFMRADSTPLSLLYPREDFFVYKAKRGETFVSIETKLGLESGTLQKANPKIKRINAGQEIVVPKEF
jgi:hypothetical protein